MKKTKFLILFTSILIQFSSESCKERKPISINSKLEGQDIDAQFIDYLNAYALNIYRNQVSCTADDANNCSMPPGTDIACNDPNVYCNDDGCQAKIICCHKIDSLQFDSLTLHQSTYHTTFKYEAMQTLMQNAQCGDCVKMIINPTTNDLEFTRLTGPPSAGDLIPHYSIALLQGVLVRYDSVVLHMGIPAGKKYLAPFKVYYANKQIGYYDVSNDYP